MESLEQSRPHEICDPYCCEYIEYTLLECCTDMVLWDRDSNGSMEQEMVMNKLTPKSRVLAEKLIFSQLVKKFPAIYGT